MTRDEADWPAGGPNYRSRASAKSLGLARYFTGALCPSGHISERYVFGGECCTCVDSQKRDARASGKRLQRPVRASKLAGRPPMVEAKALPAQIVEWDGQSFIRPPTRAQLTGGR